MCALRQLLLFGRGRGPFAHGRGRADGRGHPAHKPVVLGVEGVEGGVRDAPGVAAAHPLLVGPLGLGVAAAEEEEVRP